MSLSSALDSETDLSQGDNDTLVTSTTRTTTTEDLPSDASSIYESLRLVQDEIANIRLISILPATSSDGSDHIICKWRELDLESPRVKYTALSYTWGHELPSKEILVDGKSLQIRKKHLGFPPSRSWR